MWAGEPWSPQPPHLHLLWLVWVAVTWGSVGGRVKTQHLKAPRLKGACSPWGQKAPESGGELQHMQKLKSKDEDTSFCPSDPPLGGSVHTFPYRQCQGILLKLQECSELQNHFGGFLLQFKCPVPSASEHLPTASLQVTPLSMCQETPEGTRSATMELPGVRPPPNSTIVCPQEAAAACHPCPACRVG